MAGFEVFNASGAVQFSNTMSTITLLRKGTTSSPILLHTAGNANEVVAFKLGSGQSLEFQSLPTGVQAVPSGEVTYYVFSTKPGNSSSASYGLQLFNAQGQLTYCAATDRPLRIVGSVAENGIGTTWRGVPSPSISADSCAFLVGIGASSKYVESGSEINPGHPFRGYETFPRLERSGNNFGVVARNTVKNFMFFESFGTQPFVMGESLIHGLFINVAGYD